MEITNINLGTCPLQYLSIGYRDEYGARPVAFDFSAWATEYGAGVLQLLLQRPGEKEPFPVLLDIDGTTATWTPDEVATKNEGQGRAQLLYTREGLQVRDAVFTVLIAPSLGAAGDPPEPYEDWLQRLLTIAAEAQQSAIDAAGSAEAAGTSAGAAAGSAGAAAQSALDAEAAKTGAETAEQTAQQAVALARAKAAEAAEAGQIAGENADYAQQQRIMAEADAVDAHDSAESAAQSADDAQAAAAGANQAKTDAQSAASAAAGSAADAAAAVTEVETKGAEQITAINQAGTTQIAAVDAAGAAQVQAIEDKGEEVIASIPSDYTELADDVSDLKSSLDEIIVANRVESSWSQGYIKADGTIGQDPQSCYTDYILLSDGEWLVEAATGYKAKVAIYNDEKVFQYITIPLSSGENAFTGVNGNFARVQVTKESGNILPADITDEIISILSAPHPMLSSDIKVEWGNIENPDVQKANTAFVRPAPVNLVDLSVVTPGIIQKAGGSVDANASWVTTDYIQVEPGATYALFIFPGVYYGSGFAGIPVYNERKEQIARVTQSGGSIGAVAGRVTITIPDRADAKYIRASYYKTYADNPKRWWECQIFKASAWPTDMFMPYDGSDKIIGVGLETSESAKYNSLFGKSAMWNGDSICAADNDPQGGWPGRIASANGMMFKNYAVSGGTIAENTTASHSVSATLDTMISNFPDADYVIIEGGTNDADILGDNGIGTFDADDFSAEYIAALDKNSFSGALESIFYRLITQMKCKHIGYLIPQKMGHTEVLVACRRQYFDRATAIAQKWGIPVLDLWNGLYFNWRLEAHWDQSMTTTENENAGNLYLDGQHLTTTGYAIESPIIAEWLRTF